MVVLGIDYGRAHIGLAIGHTSTKLALPLNTIEQKSPDKQRKDIGRVIKEQGIEQIVVGVPLTWPEDKTKPGMRAEVEEFARALGVSLSLPVEFIDERRTSLGAAVLQKEGSSVDEHALAAVLILQTYLDRHKEQGNSL